MEALRVLDLFSGIGGFSLGLERTAGFKTVAFCEIDNYCKQILRRHWPRTIIENDVRTASFGKVLKRLKGRINVITAGFPCQDISDAGERAGITGFRSGLFREVVRAIRLVGPRFVLLENVAALLHRGLGSVLGDLAEVGHDAEWHCIPAAYVGARQIRDRIWIVSGPDGIPEIGTAIARQELVPWPAESTMGRVAHGVPRRVDRITALGNAVVPQIPEIIGRAILQAEGR